MNTPRRFNERGFTLAGVLALLAVMSILMALAVQLWSHVKQRDNEEELIFRGSEYIEAIARYHAKFGTYPPDIETLAKLKYIRHEYLDPMTHSGKWKVLHPDALLTTGAAGTVNAPGGPNQNSNRNGLNPNDDEDDDDRKDGLNDDDDKDRDKDDEGDGFGDDEKDKDEEPETESAGPVVGVVSRSKKSSMKLYNGQSRYNKWTFVYALPQQQRQGGAPRPGQQPGGQPGPGGNPRPVPGQKPGPGNGPGGKPVPPGGTQSPPPEQDDDDGGSQDWEKE